LAALLACLLCLTLAIVPDIRLEAQSAPAGGVTPLCVTGCGTSTTITVTPDGQAVNQYTFTTDTLTFVVSSAGPDDKSVTLNCTSTGGAHCLGAWPRTRFLDAGQQINFDVTDSIGSTGGVITLTASGSGVLGDNGSFSITVVPRPPAITLVSPALTSSGRSVVRNRQPLLLVRLGQSNAAPIDTSKTMVVWKRGAGGTPDTVTRWRADSLSVARANRGVVEWEPDSLRGIQDSALATLQACNIYSECTTVSRWIVVPADSAPILGFVGMPLENSGRQFTAPFGPGLAVSGAEVETAVGVRGYVAVGSEHTAGLSYSTRQSYPRALINVNAELPWAGAAGATVKLVLSDAGVGLDSVTAQTTACATAAAKVCRVTLQGDLSATSLGVVRKWLKLQATITSGATVRSSVDSVEVTLVDRRNSPYGSGWWPAGVPKLVQAGDDRLLVADNGTVELFRGVGDSLFISPPGEFATLTRVSSSLLRLTPRGGAQAHLDFDAYGRLAAVMDANGNVSTISYSGTTDQVTTMQDPSSHAFTFGGYGTGRLTIANPANGMSRFTINASNLLTSDSISSPASSTALTDTTSFVYQSYGGITGTALLRKRTGVINDSTVVQYDSTVASYRRRPASAQLPRVPDENGVLQTPTIRYTPYERQGAGGPVSLDSVYVQMKDPRSYWTRALLGRWDNALKTWDSLGVLSRAGYDPIGLPRYVEGKTADSSRVYTRYDSYQRPVKSFIVRAVGDTLRTDSLVYDASHRVVQRVDVRGKVSRVDYDANNNVLRTITPSSDTTQFWYSSTGVVGLVDSTRAAKDTLSVKFQYDGTWKNTVLTLSQTNDTLAMVELDSLGRPSATQHKVRGQTTNETPGATTAIWRRTETYYRFDAAVDSVRSGTVTCTDDTACSPPTSTAWNGAWSDTTRSQRVGHRYDRAGRDSLRINNRGKATEYLSDALGRLTRRRPWTDSSGVQETMAYDVAGNLRKVVTRRGDVITTDYDSRNRDTLSVIPGVGTRRKQYAGPLDQLTREWDQGPVDSIGLVNTEVRFGYDQRGRLKADTAYTGTAVRATSYSYDTYERLVGSTDANGAWSFGYEASRGLLDSIRTPLGDTLAYTFDPRTRVTRLGIINAGGFQIYRTTWTYNADGALLGMRDSVGSGGLTYLPGIFTQLVNQNRTGPVLLPLWVSQRSYCCSSDTLEDLPTYDGWERLTSWALNQHPPGSGTIGSATYSFDRDGNLYAGAVEHYDTTTDRLTQRSDAGLTRTYVYDRNGNLVSSTRNGATLTYGYDALNQLVSVRQRDATHPDSVIARYAYDVLGRRIVKRVYSTLTGGTKQYLRMVYHGDAVAYEADSLGNMGWRYVWGLGTDQLAAIDSAGSHFYVTRDRLGSVRALISKFSANEWKRGQAYDPYGLTIQRDSAADGGVPTMPRYLWTAREYDPETGWYYLRARYYSASDRRFVQEDPAGYAGGDNLYAYVGGAVLEARDPSGLQSPYGSAGRDEGAWWDLHFCADCEAPGAGYPMVWTNFEWPEAATPYSIPPAPIIDLSDEELGLGGPGDPGRANCTAAGYCAPNLVPGADPARFFDAPRNLAGMPVPGLTGAAAAAVATTVARYVHPAAELNMANITVASDGTLTVVPELGGISLLGGVDIGNPDPTFASVNIGGVACDFVCAGASVNVGPGGRFGVRSVSLRTGIGFDFRAAQSRFFDRLGHFSFTLRGR
jgi:RHS repeat-associated protein